MATKSFKTAPRPAAPSAAAIAEFEQKGAGKDTAARPVAPANSNEAEPTARLSLDIPASLHADFKAACAKKRTKMTAEILDFIRQRTAELTN